MYFVDHFSPKHLLNLHSINLDYKTESFTFDYYLNYLFCHNTDCFMIHNSDNNMAYLIGKHENKNKILSGHVSALTVAPSFRRWGLGNILMQLLETNGNNRKAFFIDLFVRKSNKQAIGFYKKNGYILYREIKDYYIKPVENALDMRKGLKMDVDRMFVVPTGEVVNTDEMDE